MTIKYLKIKILKFSILNRNKNYQKRINNLLIIKNNKIKKLNN